ncbi:hypothetical protein AB751O23_AP_00160 [Chlamydiales bacterium SCGC AB-751-O23]|jgi:hypothetical protein|nr:hypothetical protein AB751O23_AP_00160 [Chlamydiales bacterium SCGC AB-751-O23]
MKNQEVSLSVDELIIINNSLNEVCNGLDIWEFETRMGFSKEEVSKLLEKVNALVDSVDKNTDN